MNKVIISLLFAFSAFWVTAQSLNPDDATKIARNFFKERNYIHHPGTPVNASVINMREIKEGGETLFYIFNFDTGGFVIVSASSFTFPVLAYSLQSEFTGSDEPGSLSAWMRYYGRQIGFAEQSRNAAPEIIDMHERWSGSSLRNIDPVQNRVVEPLLQTTWDQGNYYNALCPADEGGPGGHCWAGCVATAVGQLMFYHRWPNQGTGEYTYTHPVYGVQYANFGETTYNWNGMETSLNGPNDHIALLLNHLGISFDMDYGPDGSGMWNHSAANSMRNFFKYGPQTQYIFRDTTTMNWDSILVANLDARKPLYYAGWEGVGSQNGHAFVCDGYSPDNFYHFNWGWSSSYDGYFLLSALTPGGNNFNFAQEVIKDIYPDTLQYNYPEYCNGPDTIESVSGTFSDGSNMVNYPGNSDCFWLIQPNEPDFDSITSINLDFPYLDLSENDRVRVYQGTDTTATMIADITGNLPPSTISIPANTFLVRFTSDANDDADGFLGSYKSVLPVYCSGTTTFTDSTGVFDDGSGDKMYSNNAICKWKIIPENLVPLTLTFESFNTESESDLLRIYDLGTQELVATLSGDTLPGPLTITGGKAYLVFMTNKQTTAPGWTVRWAPEGTTGQIINEIDAVNIYPNPVEDQLWINPGKYSEDQVELRIFNAAGLLIKKDKINLMNDTGIDTGNLKAGFYIMTISCIKGMSSHRFVKF